MKSLLTVILLQFSIVTNLFGLTPKNWDTINLFDSKPVNIDLTTKNNYSVFIFLSGQCPCSQGFSQHLNELSQKYKNIKFYAVLSNKDEDYEKSKIYYSQTMKFKFPVLVDKKATLADDFKALKTPHIFVVDSKLKTIYSGGVADRRMIQMATKFYLQEVLEDLKNNKAPRHKLTKTLGCYIRR